MGREALRQRLLSEGTVGMCQGKQEAVPGGGDSSGRSTDCGAAGNPGPGVGGVQEPGRVWDCPSGRAGRELGFRSQCRGQPRASCSRMAEGAERELPHSSRPPGGRATLRQHPGSWGWAL